MTLTAADLNSSPTLHHWPQRERNRSEPNLQEQGEGRETAFTSDSINQRQQDDNFTAIDLRKEIKRAQESPPTQLEGKVDQIVWHPASNLHFLAFVDKSSGCVLRWPRLSCSRVLLQPIHSTTRRLAIGGVFEVLCWSILSMALISLVKTSEITSTATEESCCLLYTSDAADES